MKRICLFLLCIAMLLPGALTSISCAGPGTDDPVGTDRTSSAGTDAASEAETADPAFSDDLPALDFKSETISIFASRRPGAEDELYAEGINHELIKDAVYERNRIVEDRLNVRLDVQVDTDSGSHYSVANTIHNLVMTGTDDYQICTGPAYVTVIFCVKGDYLDLPSFEHLDLGKHYWSQGSMRWRPGATGISIPPPAPWRCLCSAICTSHCTTRIL